MEEESITIQPTGIEDIDAVLGGGIPEGHVVLLAGDSGTGKTVFSMEWLFKGYSKHGQNGLYITLTEPITEATRNVQQFSFYDAGAFNDGVHFTDLRTTLNLLNLQGNDIDKEDVEEIVSAIEDVVKQTRAKRVVIDSITALAYMLKEKDLIRYFIFRLGAILNSLDCSTILTSEVSEDNYSVYGVEEFISDAIIKMEQEPVHDDLQRTLQIIKMRGVSYDSHAFPFTITGDGLTFHIAQPDMEYRAFTERVESGINGLDDMIDGGLLKGSVSLVSGPTGAGKTLTSLHFTCAGLETGETCLYVSFEEGANQIHRMAKHFGWDLASYEDEGMLTLRCRRPRSKTPAEHITDITDIVEEQDIDRVVVDSLTGIRNAYSEEAFHDFSRALALSLKELEVTTMMTSSDSSMIGLEGAARGRISTLMDNIILLNYVEAQGMMKYTITILKTRSTDHDRALREYDILPDGIHIGGMLSGYEGVMTGTATKIGETTEEQIRREFLDHLGPIGLPEFEQLQEQGLTESRLTAYIDELAESGAIPDENAEEFKERIRAILNGDDIPAREQHPQPESDDTSGILDRLLGG